MSGEISEKLSTKQEKSMDPRTYIVASDRVVITDAYSNRARIQVTPNGEASELPYSKLYIRNSSVNKADRHEMAGKSLDLIRFYTKGKDGKPETLIGWYAILPEKEQELNTSQPPVPELDEH